MPKNGLSFLMSGSRTDWMFPPDTKIVAIMPMCGIRAAEPALSFLKTQLQTAYGFPVPTKAIGGGRMLKASEPFDSEFCFSPNDALTRGLITFRRQN
jgi:hypothetical protein